MTRREMTTARKRAKEGIASPMKGKSAYQMFCKDHPELDSLEDRKERSKKLRELWKALDTEKKAEYVYAKGANGMTARVPVDRLEQWKAAQDELRQQMRDGTYQPDKAKAAEL